MAIRNQCGRVVMAAAVAASVSWMAPSLAANLPDLGEAARAELSPQIERRIGDDIMNEIRLREPTYLDDQELNDYLERIGRRLVENSDNPVGEYHFFALRDNSVNAFAMFGGYIGINTGTILTAQSESELASVIAHEIAHVTQNHLARQLAREKQNTIPSLIALAVGILAARSNADIASAAIASTQAAMVQSQLAYSREFEREADRMGYQLLEKAGFEVRGMGDFFDRLHRASRLYENNAPVYLRSHPLTLERISDMQNRAQESPYRQVVSSLDFHILRARLKVLGVTPREAIKDFETQLRERKYASQAAVVYGLAFAYFRDKNLPAAQRQVDTLIALKASSPMIASLAAEVRLASGDRNSAQAIYREALQRFPQAMSLVYGYAESLVAAQEYEQSLAFLASQLQLTSADYKLYGLQAKSFAALGKRMQQHRAQAEFYLLQGQLGAAVEQLQLAQKSPDGDFFEQSAVDARLRELLQRQNEEARQKRAMP